MGFLKKRLHLFSFFLTILLFFSIASCGKKKKKHVKKRIDPMIKSEKLIREGRYMDALDLLTRIRKTKKDDKLFWNRYGMALRYNSFLENDAELRTREIKSFKKALKLDSEYSIARMNLASSLWETGKKELAIEQYNKLLKMDPSFNGAKSIKKRLASHEERKIKRQELKKKRKEKKLELKRLKQLALIEKENNVVTPGMGKSVMKKVVSKSKKKIKP